MRDMSEDQNVHCRLECSPTHKLGTALDFRPTHERLLASFQIRVATVRELARFDLTGSAEMRRQRHLLAIRLGTASKTRRAASQCNGEGGHSSALRVVSASCLASQLKRLSGIEEAWSIAAPQWSSGVGYRLLSR
jgi:hypothetical protein